jgi:hypothetical protein
MKRLIIATVLAALNLVPLAHADSNDQNIFIEGQLLKTYMPAELSGVSSKICLSVIDQHGQLLALVEDISFCHYARTWRRSHGKHVVLDTPALEMEQDDDLTVEIGQHYPDAKIIMLETE